MMVHTIPDILESSPRVLGFMTQGNRYISGFQQFKTLLSRSLVTSIFNITWYICSNRALACGR